MDTLTEAQREEAARIARIAERAEQRTSSNTQTTPSLLTFPPHPIGAKAKTSASPAAPNGSTSSTPAATSRPRFLSKKQREKEASERVEGRRRAVEKKRAEEKFRLEREREARVLEERKRRREEREEAGRRPREAQGRGRGGGRSVRARREEKNGGAELEDEMSKPEVLAKIKESYLGSRKELRKKAAAVNPSVRGKGQRFKFDWDDSDDTSHDLNPLYANPVKGSVIFGGNVAGVDSLAKKERSRFLSTIIDKRYGNAKRGDMASSDSSERRRLEEKRDKLRGEESALSVRSQKFAKNWRDKTLEEMTPRDWRIVREDHDIYVKGSRVMNPARNWEELDLSETLRAAIRRLGYKRPSPIQMQAIPIGLHQRKLTRSYKIPAITRAFRRYHRRGGNGLRKDCCFCHSAAGVSW